MSVATIPSPQTQLRVGKRLLEDHAFDLPASQQQQHKRLRVQRSPQPAATSLRCGLPFHQQQEAAQSTGVFPSTNPEQCNQAYQALLALFPGMDDKVVQGVLVECNYSIDAAIKRLTDLRLSTEEATVAAATAAASSSKGTADGAAADAQQEGSNQQAATSTGTDEDTITQQGPQTAEQWIDFLVAEMLASKDMGDARGRAAVVLQHFERFVKQRQKQESDAKVSELVKENTIYKRAVQIQANRMAAKQGQEEELAQLRHTVSQYQEQCRKLELHAYSLAMHLQQATSSGGNSMPHQRHPPDVF